MPNPSSLPLTENDESDPHISSVPFVFVADDASQLTSYCRKPYGGKNMADAQGIFDYRLSRKKMTDAQRIFDYRLSRKHRGTENAFGILANRFRVFPV